MNDHGTATRADVEVALVLLERLGVRPEQLVSGLARTLIAESGASKRGAASVA
jgi:hypothetical protein